MISYLKVRYSAHNAVKSGDCTALHLSLIVNIFVSLYLRPERSTVNGQRSTVNGQRSTVNGQRSTVNGQRSTVNGQRSTVNGGEWGASVNSWYSRARSRGARARARGVRAESRGLGRAAGGSRRPGERGDAVRSLEDPPRLREASRRRAPDRHRTRRGGHPPDPSDPGAPEGGSDQVFPGGFRRPDGASRRRDAGTRRAQGGSGADQGGVCGAVGRGRDPVSQRRAGAGRGAAPLVRRPGDGSWVRALPHPCCCVAKILSSELWPG